MAVTRASVIKGFHESARAQGDMRVSADYSLQIDGFEDHWLFCRTQFWPLLTAGEGIEVPSPLGAAMWQPSQSKFHQQAQVTFQESSSGIIQSMFKDMLVCTNQQGSVDGKAGMARFNAWVYYGTPGEPEKYIQRARIEHAFIVVDEPVETDWESRTEIITIPGTIYYHFYGQYEDGSGNLC